VPRHLRFDVPERIAADGSVLEPLDEKFVRRLVAELRDKGISAIGVCYLNSFRNPAHEKRAAEIIAEVAPKIRVSLSSEVVAEIREFQRTSTTLVNVYVQERVADYLAQLQARLDKIGFAGSFFVMLSSGGIATRETSSRFPVRLLESGPAAGAIAAAEAACFAAIVICSPSTWAARRQSSASSRTASRSATHEFGSTASIVFAAACRCASGDRHDRSAPAVAASRQSIPSVCSRWTAECRADPDRFTAAVRSRH
jgi:hypothetical protein